MSRYRAIRGSASAGAAPTLEQVPPAGEHLVNLRCADDRVSGSGKPTGARMNGRVCAPADPAVERDQLLERAALLEVGS